MIDEERSQDDDVDFKYQGGTPVPDNVSWKYIMLTSGRWAVTEGGCASTIALGIFAILFMVTCSIIVAFIR